MNTEIARYFPLSPDLPKPHNIKGRPRFTGNTRTSRKFTGKEISVKGGKKRFRILEIGSEVPLDAMVLSEKSVQQPNPYMKNGLWLWYTNSMKVSKPYNTKQEALEDYIEYLEKNQKDESRASRQARKRMRKI